MTVTITMPKSPEFRAGEPVVILYQGVHNGMHGRFVGIRPDPNWADVKEDRSGKVTSHPVRWLRHREEVQDHLAKMVSGTIGA